MTSGARLPTWKERENNKKRERRRRAIASKIFSGLRQYGNYKLPKHCDNNEVLKALCQEAGWVVEDDGTTYRKGAKPVERMEVCASAPASPSPTSSYHNNTGTNGGGMTPGSEQQQQGSGASLIPWLKGLSGASTPTSSPMPCYQSAPVTPPLSCSPRQGGSTAAAAVAAAAAAAATQANWDRVAMAENWVNGGTWSPVIVGPAIPAPGGSNHGRTMRPCETPDGCLTPCSDVGDSEPNVNEILSRYSGNKSGRWINGTRVVPTSAPGTNFVVGSSGTATPIQNSRAASPSMANNLGHHFGVENGTVVPWMGGGFQNHGQQQQQQSQAHHHHGSQQHYQQKQQQQQQHGQQHGLHGHHHQHQQQAQQALQLQQQQQQNLRHPQQQHASRSQPVLSQKQGQPQHNFQQQQQTARVMNLDQCSPSSSSVCGVVVHNKRKRSSHEMLDLEMSSSVTRLEIDAAKPAPADTTDAATKWAFTTSAAEPASMTRTGSRSLSDRLELTLATPASSS